MSVLRDDDLARYVAGLMDDPQEIARVEQALEQDPQMRARLDELFAALEPAPATLACIQEQFDELDRARWLTIRSTSGEGPGYLIEPEPGRPMALDVQATEMELRLRLAGPLAGTPASVALFHPLEAAFEPLRLTSASEEPAALAARTGRQPAWTTPRQSNSQGVTAWLEEDWGGVRLRIEAPTEADPLGRLNWALRWQPEEGAAEQHLQGHVELLAGETTRSGKQTLKGLQAAQLKRASHWEVTLAPAGFQEVPVHDSRAYRALVGEDLEVLILSDKGDGVLVAPFHTETQRKLWADPTACRALCLKP